MKSLETPEITNQTTPSIILSREEVGKMFGDDFVQQQILTLMDIGKEYLIDNEWISNAPNQKPDDCRIVFNNPEELQTAQDVAAVWSNLSDIFFSRPIHPEIITKRLFESRKENKARTLFTPWGHGPQASVGVKERSIFYRIRQVINILNAASILTEPLIMPADLYALQIDARPPAEVNQYFTEIERLADEFGFTPKKWSQIRIENISRYDQLAAELSDEELTKIIPETIIEGAVYQAGLWSGYNNQEQIEQAAYDYLRERIIEATIVNEVYAPIKLSAVARGKDVFVDGPLPAIYVIPPDEQFPWLPRRGSKNDRRSIR